MSFLSKATAFLPLGKKEEQLEYFFAVNIGVEKLTAALWTIEGKQLKVLNTASADYPALDEIATGVDRLLDQVLGLKEVEPQKILFGVPDTWLSGEDLKEEYLKILRNLVKELELTPMAYVATSHALVHFLEKQEGVPATAILVGFEKLHLTVTVVRAGKLDGVKVIKRDENAGSDIEKTLFTFTDVETLPSRILTYGFDASELKNQLLSFSWMSKLSFLHFPKIDVLEDEVEIKSVCLAGGSEINPDVVYIDQPAKKQKERVNILAEESPEVSDKLDKLEDQKIVKPEPKAETADRVEQDDFGFMVGDVAAEAELEGKQARSDVESNDEPADFTEEEPDGVRRGTRISGAEDQYRSKLDEPEEMKSEDLTMVRESNLELDDFSRDSAPKSPVLPKKHKKKLSFTALSVLFGIIGIIALVVGAYIFFVKADVKVFVEPKIVENDAQVIADPNQKTVNEEGKIIPGQIIETEISGSAKDNASGKRQIGDPAKGTIIVYNKTSDPQTLSKGTQVSGSGGIKFTLDTSVTIASQSASDSGITFGKANTTVTATAIGADGNLPSGSDFTIAGQSADKMVAKSEGNFSGGTSKDVTVVSSEDQQKLLAKLSSDLRQQSQQKLQEKYPDKKILQEALLEQITSKKYSKNINDQANEFSLNMTVKYRGTAYNDADLKTIVSKLVTTQVPDGFELNLSETETQADVAKLEKDGKVVFLAKFKTKLIPKIDTEKIKNQIKFKTSSEVADILKGMENVLGSEIKMTPNLPKILERMPILSKNITVEVGLK
ncbi:baseplate J/gp47 family protein [Patescibacteria group bacterium]|nr:baseplate J/gp47 family protein [Patescibacteria group bacterium]